MDVKHLYDVLGVQKMKFFLKHLRLEDKTGQLLRISMEYTQLQIGILNPFFLEHYNKWKHVVILNTIASTNIGYIPLKNHMVIISIPIHLII